MKISLELPRCSVRLPLRDYDPDLDDVRSILFDLCTGAPEGFEFRVSGFGQERWPVDVTTDLVVMLEQLPEALHAVESNASATLDFYEQGIQRILSFDPVLAGFEVRCASLTRWQPNPEIETVSAQELRAMLRSLLTDFMSFVRHAAPQIVEHPWMVSWLNRAGSL